MFTADCTVCQEKNNVILTFCRSKVNKETHPHGGEGVRYDGLSTLLIDNPIQFLQHIIGGGNHFRIRLIRALRHNHVG